MKGKGEEFILCINLDKLVDGNLIILSSLPHKKHGKVKWGKMSLPFCLFYQNLPLEKPLLYLILSFLEGSKKEKLLLVMENLEEKGEGEWEEGGEEGLGAWGGGGGGSWRRGEWRRETRKRFIFFHFLSFSHDLFYFILFYFILFYFILFYFILFYFILFYFILFYFILFYFIFVFI